MMKNNFKFTIILLIILFQINTFATPGLVTTVHTSGSPGENWSAEVFNPTDDRSVPTFDDLIDSFRVDHDYDVLLPF